MSSNIGETSSPFILGFTVPKVIIEKSRGEGSLMEQDTIENVYYSYLSNKRVGYNKWVG